VTRSMKISLFSLAERLSACRNKARGEALISQSG
jgi:hypothetical protein